MKKTHIAMIVAIAIVSAILIGSVANASKSVTFAKAETTPGQEFKVSGTFDRAHEVIYDPLADSDLTIFYMKDKEGNSKKVYLHDNDGKPMGLEQSESVDLHGSFDEHGEFHASDILMKCPSKYNQNKHALQVEQ